MHFNAYGGNAALLAAALSNLDDGCDAAALEELLSEHRVARARLTTSQLAELRDWSARLWAAFAAPSVTEKVAVANKLLAEAAASPYVSTHDGQPPHLHYADEHADVVTRVRAVTAAGLATVLTEAGPQRLGRCAAPGCRTVYVDVSRNGRRAYCSRLCATRVHVSAHRARSLEQDLTTARPA
ncbi:MAG: CGNR zinc finger domain-containing protein [Pseudonocardiales bacterium]|nr:CGNR zinc finger domain-containing protein [Pseudonocardiales bacterium]